jgi:hypothetical protein
VTWRHPAFVARLAGLRAQVCAVKENPVNEAINEVYPRLSLDRLALY